MFVALSLLRPCRARARSLSLSCKHTLTPSSSIYTCSTTKCIPGRRSACLPRTTSVSSPTTTRATSSDVGKSGMLHSAGRKVSKWRRHRWYLLPWTNRPPLLPRLRRATRATRDPKRGCGTSERVLHIKGCCGGCSNPVRGQRPEKCMGMWRAGGGDGGTDGQHTLL